MRSNGEHFKETRPVQTPGSAPLSYTNAQIYTPEVYPWAQNLRYYLLHRTYYTDTEYTDKQIPVRVKRCHSL